MPAYDYRCTSCDHVFEVTRSAAEKRDETCPVCAGVTKRVFTPVGVVFKGSGFHNTDYRPKPTDKDTPEPASKTCASKTDSSACSSCPAGTAD